MFLSTSLSILPSTRITHKSRDEIALNDLPVHFNNKLQKLLKNAGFNFAEREICHRSFLDFMHFTLLHLGCNVRDTKNKLSLDLFEKEKNILAKLECNISVQDEVKMNKAIELMKKDLPTILKDYMLRSGFKLHETEQRHSSYLSLVSSFIVLESEKMFRYKNRFMSSEDNKHVYEDKIESISSPRYDFIKVEKDNSQCDSSKSSLYLFTTTRKHFIYFCPKQNIAIKALKTKKSLAKDVENLSNELKVAKSISHPSFRQSIERTNFEGKEALTLQWSPGLPINQLEKVSVRDFLSIAREIVSALLPMHVKQIMHMNLTCDHIIFDPESRNIKIIGCGSSMNFNNKPKYVSNQELLEKDLRYISPEQTGRINRDIDYRSDFYSLGIVYYRLLTGKYPFKSENALKLLYLQIHQDPTPVHTIDSKLPASLSTMISNLMAKNADDRYQSTKGIMYDLDLFISEYETDEKLQSIKLGQHDVPQTLFIPQKLYGHSTYIQALLSVFDRAQTSFEIVFVVGNSGSGKSALVHELFKPVIQIDGIYISGKYDFSLAEPYSALLEAVISFCDDLLLRDKSQQSSFKHQIIRAIGDEGKLLTDVITNLHLIIGNQPSTSDAYGQEAKNRFHYVFIKFIKAVCSLGHPIVLVLEDLQWMDAESFNLLSMLMTDKSVKNLMLVGSYRDNEINDNHLVTRLLDYLEKVERKWTHIKIDNLDHENINEFLSDALSVPPLETYALTAILFPKTKGNPFFVKQVLKFLYEQGLIYFCNCKCKWQWDATIFGEDDVYEDVKQLLRLKILSFDEHTQQVLKVASCIGSTFSIRTIKLIVNRSDSIKCAISSGMIIQCKGSDTMYQFVHDNIQEAAYSLLPDNPKEILLYIGKKLWTLLSKQELHENIFIVVRLLNDAVDLLIDEEERSQIAELFLQAGDKALSSTAFTQAFGYLESGIKLLSIDCWNNQYEFSLRLHEIAAKSAYCICNYARMDEIIVSICKNVISSLHMVQSYSLKIKHCNDERKFEDAISTAVHFLDMLDERIIYNRCSSMTPSEMLRLKNLIAETSEESILGFKEIDNDRLSSIMMILHDITYSCFFSNPQLMASVSARSVQLTLMHGVSKFSPLGFAVFGSVLCSQGDPIGYQLGKISMKLLDRTQAKESKPWVYIVYFALITPFHISIHQTIDPFLEAYSISLEIGSHSSCKESAISFCTLSFLSGKPLENLRDDIDDLIEAIPAMKTRTVMSIYQVMHNLLNKEKEKPGILTGNYFDCAVCFTKNEQGYDISRVTMICCIIAYIFHDYESAFEFVKICRLLKAFIKGTYFYPNFLFYESLILLALSNGGLHDKIHIVQCNLLELKILSKSSPENYLNKYYLIKAEISSVLNSGDDMSNYQEAMKLSNEYCILHEEVNNGDEMSNYFEAIKLSNEHCFLHEEAIACERAAMFLLRSSSTEQVSQLLRRACKCYESWGAKSKKLELFQKYPSTFNDDQQFAGLCDTELLVENNSQASVSLLSEKSNFSTSSSTLHSKKRDRLS